MTAEIIPFGEQQRSRPVAQPRRRRGAARSTSSTSRTKQDYLREAQAANPSDPIRALIEADRRAYADYLEALHFSMGLYDDDPRHEQAELVTNRCDDIKDAFLDDLLAAKPATMAGNIALAAHYGEISLRAGGEEMTIEDLREALDNLARSLSAIAVD